VQDDDQCSAVVDEALTTAAPGSVIVVHSTVLPATVQRLGELAAARGVEVLDAPLAGTGEAGVRDATMWALVGGSPSTIDRTQPLLARYTARVLRTGALGSGAALKLAHNVFVYLGYRAVQEAHDLARAAGVADGLLAEVSTASGMMSPSFRVYHDIYEHRVGLPDGEREPGPFATYASILEKDLRQAVEVAAGFGLQLPVAELVRHRGEEIYRV
jgi:3-hydroxyisobutyrate dehydrogenase-like beta-hydroxyacid dehydrogenase